MDLNLPNNHNLEHKGLAKMEEENRRQRVHDAGERSQQVTAGTPTIHEESSVLANTSASAILTPQHSPIQQSEECNTVLIRSEMSHLNNEKNAKLVQKPVEIELTFDQSTEVLTEIQEDVKPEEQTYSQTSEFNDRNGVIIADQLATLAIPTDNIEKIDSESLNRDSVDVAMQTEVRSVTIEVGDLDVNSETLLKVSSQGDRVEVVETDRGEDLKESTEVGSGPVHGFVETPREITGAWEDFKSGNGECFTKGCKWSPDGTCLLVNSDDNVLRIYDLPAELHCQAAWPRTRTLPEMRPALSMKEGGLVYDYCWYPLMSSWDPLSCCLVSAAQDSPVHMWDAFTGQLRATYRAYNQVDEVEAAHCVAFDPCGEKLYCGFKNVVRVFNTAQPGRQCETRRLKDAEVAEAQRGIVSCVCVNPAMSNIYAVGTYLKSVGLYCEPRGSALCLATGHVGGVTHLVFSHDGTKLYSGARKDPEIVCWDIRNPGTVLYTLRRKVSTNQRITFDITADDRYLLSGQSDGQVAVWDLLASPVALSGGDPVLPTLQTFTAHEDCANGVSVHQQYPILATSSGQRHFAELGRESSDSDSGSPLLKRRYIRPENAVKLWWTAGE